MLLLLLACGPTAVTVGEPDTESVDTGDTAPPPEPDFSTWTGERVVNDGQGCEETLTESGGALEAGWEYYDWLESECPQCDWFYLVQVSPDTICGFRVQEEVLRGLDLDDLDQVGVYGFRQEGGFAFDEGATLEGLSLDYAYTLESDEVTLDVRGTVTFDAL